MGQWMAKLTGDDKRVDQMNRDAETQAQLTREAAAKSAEATREAAAQAARTMELQASRSAAEQAASDAANKPAENADVLLSNPATTAPSAAKKRRTQFGTGYTSGVKI